MTRPVGDTFVKRRAGAPPGFTEVEAAGLRWLAAAPGGVPAVRPLEVAADRIVLPRLATVGATAAAAEEFGRRLAATHRAGAPWFGAPPAGHDGDGFIAELPLPHQVPEPAPEDAGWGPFYARLRLLPFAAASPAVAAVCERLLAGDPELVGPVDPPSRIHGDLWSGNVLWTSSGAVLIDPAAHGGHRETDLAMLALFGLPHLDRVLAAYDESHPLPEGWQSRVPLHQLHPLLVHARLFGGSYIAEADRVARRYG